VPEPTPTPFARLRAPSHLLAIGLLLAITILGAAQLAFLCDDAYITFRYVSNARDGLGLVWHPPRAFAMIPR